MSLQQMYGWAKKIHTLSMWFTLGLGIPMMLSGLSLHKIIEGEGDFIPIDHELVRWVHGRISNYFAIALAMMMVTGFLMWILPKWLRRQAQSKLS